MKNFIEDLKYFFHDLINIEKESKFLIDDLLVLDPETLTKKEIEKVISFKMKFLLKNKVMKKEISLFFEKKHICAIKKFQNRFRGFLIKKSFLKAIETDRYIKQKKNYQKIRKRIESFDNSVITKKFSFRCPDNYSKVYKSIKNFRENDN